MKLSKPQKQIYNMESLMNGSVSCVCGCMLLDTVKTEAQINEALGIMYRMNDALRIRIKKNGENVSQYITQFKDQFIPALYFDSREELNAYADSYAKIPFESDGPLSEITPVILPSYSGVLIKMHHIISDGWTCAMVASQMKLLLTGFMPEAYSYADYLTTEEEYLSSKRYLKDKEYFTSKINECSDPVFISDKADISFVSERKSFRIHETQRLEDFCRKLNTSVFAVILAVTSFYFSRVKENADNFFIGTTVLNRTGEKERNTMGMYVNTVPVLMKPDYSATVADNISAVSSDILSVLRHQKFNYIDILEETGKGKLFDVIVSYQNAQIVNGETIIEWYSNGMQAENLQIHVEDHDADGTLKMHFDYRTDKFTEDEINTLHNHIINLLNDCMENPDKKIGELSILSENEKTVLSQLNNTQTPYQSEKCVHTLIEEQTEKTPDKTAIVGCDKTITYRELNETANRIAHSLAQKGIGRGDIVAFRMRRTTSLVASMLAILKTGAAYLPIDPDYPEERIAYMLSDSGAKFCITDENINELLENENTENINIHLNSSDVCYCIYTSGSTGKPKGTLITHRNVVNYISANEKNVCYGITKDAETILSVTTAGFDIFVTETLLPLANGMKIVLANEEESRLQSRLIDLLEKNPCDVIQTTPTKMKTLMTDKSRLEFLNNFKTIILGGETLDTTLVNELKSVTDAEIYNIYGPTEATVWATYARVEDAENITIGKPMANTQIHIVDKYMNLVPLGVQGELCIAGDCVVKGYYNRDDLTNEKFIDNPFGEGKLYRTGDIAYWNNEGNIVFVGRNDFQVKIRGLRIELGEIENAVSAIEGINLSVAVVREDKQGRQFICVFYTGEEVSSNEIKEQISQKLPKYMIPHFFTHIEDMPLTSSGKINRKALPEVKLENIETATEYIAPATDKEITVTECITDVLGCDKVSVLDNFFDIGGDSLKAIELSAKLESKGYEITVREIFDSKNIRELAEKLTEKTTEYVKAEYGNRIPATAAQMRVYTAQLMNPDSTLYNITGAVRTENIDKTRLINAVNELVARHESLRTHFENVDGTIYQIIDKHTSAIVDEISDINDFAKPFDLSVAPLMRVGYNENTIAIDIHHIIADGETINILFSEFNELYMGNELPEAVQYGEFAVTDGYSEADEKYWIDLFREEVPELSLPYDFARGNIQSFNGNTQYFKIEHSLHEKIEEKCSKLSITPYVYYMACYSILLSKYSGNEDLVIGTPVNGRKGRFVNTVGMFVNTIAFRTKPEGNKRIDAFLKEVRDNSIKAIDKQSYPFGELIKKLGIETNGRNPLFDTMFAYQHNVAEENGKTQLLEQNITQAKYDMTFNVIPNADNVMLTVEYCTDLFREKTIEKFISSYKTILESALDETSYIKNISVADEEIPKQLNNTQTPYQSEKCVYTLIEEQTEKTPDKTAIVGCDKTITYRELNETANRIAHALAEKGIGRGDIVAFRMRRTTLLVASMLAILKTGAAYLPADPDYPEERIAYMLSDSGAKFCITDDNINELLENDNTENINIHLNNSDVCYCIYTSGSTGKPKGTLITHRNVVNYISANEKNVCYGITKDAETILSVTTAGFDIFVTETLLPLANGMKIVLANEEESRLQSRLIDLLEKNPCDVIQTTPTKMKTLMTDKSRLEFLNNFKTIILGGETLDTTLVNELKSVTDAEIYNIYGPTEATVWATYARVEDAENITIGKPMANTQIHIVDKYMNLVPLGVQGELCIAGDCVVKGYYNRDDLTNEKFIDNPFGEGKLYRTGDIAYWNNEGNIVFVGRNDFQVKIRGLRIELGEIENAVSAIEGINLSVAVVREDKQGRQFICVFYTGEEVSSNEIKEQISQKLPKYMIPHFFTHIEDMPLTSSGKINRKALPEVKLENIETATEYIAPATDKEITVTECITDVLGCDKVSVLDNFFDIGGDSLKAIELSAKLESKGYEITVREIFDSKNIRELAEKLTEKTTEYVKVEYGNIIPATNAQMRVYTSQNMKSDSAHYNIPYAFKVKELDISKLENAINMLIARHESLRTRFENRDGQIMQVIEEKITITVEHLSSDDITLFNIPFDLRKAPLLRVGYYENTVFIVTHHIVSDGETMNVLLRELNELYMGRKLSETVQYGEFAVTDGYSEADEKYWLSVFDEDAESINLRTDFTRPERQSFEGKQIYELIDVHNIIEEKCRKLAITPYVYYMACYSILLSKYSGNEDIVTAMPVSGRTNRFINTVGMFVNTVAMRTKPEGNKTVETFLNEVKECSISAIDNQNYPLNELIKKLGIDISSRNPLADIMFAYQSEQTTDIVFGDSKAEIQPVALAGVKCDLNFTVMPRENDAVLMAEYSSDIFMENTVNEFIESYKTILVSALDATQSIKDISVLSETEKHKILVEFNDTQVEYNKNTCIYKLFEEQVKINPEKTAVIFKDKRFTYSELYTITEEYAGKLVSLGIKADDTVAVHLERSHMLVVLQLAVLKIGGIFLPIDKRYPEDRINYACKDCNIKLFITDENISPETDVISINELENTESVSAETVINNNSCYIIYTSGSTGKPKGCLLTGKGLLNFCKNNNTLETLNKIENCTFACVNAVSFDYFIAESLLPLTNGFATVILDEEESTIQHKFMSVAEKNGINVLMTTPTRLKIFFNGKGNTDVLKQLKCICTSGEPLTEELLVQMYEKSPEAKVYNPIGPSECSVWDMGGELNREDGIDIHIGKPIANAQIYITDKYLNPVPIGVTGEICIAGDGVGNGYVNNPELTEEKFVENPFGKGKLYKTGDLGYWRADGNIVFIGRNDFQVKIRGLRIELGEIENAVSEVDGINLAVAVVRTDEQGRQHICVFYTGEEKTSNEIKEQISQKLPKYMVPHIFIHLDDMPMTSSGKINRKALPEIDFVNSTEDTEFSAPYTSEEKALSEVVCSVLRTDRISMRDNFFELGGDSINAIYIVSALEEKGYELHVSDIMQKDNFADVAKSMKPIAEKLMYEQDEVNGFIPFTPIMRAYVNENKYIPKDYVHSCILTADCDEDIAEKAIDVLVSHHDILRGTLSDDGIEILPSDVRKAYSFSTITISDNEKAKEYLSNIYPDEDKLVKVVFCRTENKNLIRIMVHHFLIDLISWEILIKDFSTLIMQLKNNQEVSLPAKTASFMLYNEKLKDYKETVNETSKAYWKNVNNSLDKAKHLYSSAETLNESENFNFVLEADYLNGINNTFGTRTNEVLLTALGLAAGKIAEGSVGIMVESHGRTGLHQPISLDRTVGWFTSCYPVVVANNNNTADELSVVKQTFRKIPSNGIDYLLFYDFHKNADIIFNFYQNSIEERERNEHLVSFGSDNSLFPGKINVNCYIANDILTVSVAVPECKHKKHIAEELGNEFRKQIEKFAENCSATDPVTNTCSDFTDDELTETELDELKELFDWTDDDEE